MFSKMIFTENVAARIKETPAAGGNIWVVDLFQDDWQVAHLIFASYCEATDAATDWIESH